MLGGTGRDHPRRIADQPVDELELRAVRPHLVDHRRWRIPGHRDVGAYPGARGVGGHGRPGVARRRHADVADAQLHGSGQGDGDATRLERPGRVGAFFLHPQVARADRLAEARRAQQRRDALAERRHRRLVAHGQQLRVTPQGGDTPAERFAREASPRRVDVVAGEQRAPARAADVLHHIGVVALAADRALEVRQGRAGRGHRVPLRAPSPCKVTGAGRDDTIRRRRDCGGRGRRTLARARHPRCAGGADRPLADGRAARRRRDRARLGRLCRRGADRGRPRHRRAGSARTAPVRPRGGGGTGDVDREAAERDRADAARRTLPAPPRARGALLRRAARRRAARQPPVLLRRRGRRRRRLRAAARGPRGLPRRRRRRGLLGGAGGDGGARPGVAARRLVAEPRPGAARLDAGDQRARDGRGSGSTPPPGASIATLPPI